MELGSENGHQSANRSVGPQRRRVDERHLNASETLRPSVGRAYEAVQRVATIEVGNPRNSRVVVRLSIGIGARHGGRLVPEVDRIRSTCRRCNGDAGIDGGAKGHASVLVKLQTLRKRFADENDVVAARTDFVL